ncbi:MAG: hypothetical protein J6S58_05815, partial [Lentisphaeria bacterium]|nr:hypothetical protein [Lentisphaeria bacterium]
MGLTARQRIMKVGLEQAAADYIACMTDRFAAKEYERLAGAMDREQDDDL